MFKYYQQITWLKLRHASTGFTRIMYITGSDFTQEKDVLDRTYQVYVLLAIVAALFLGWLGVLDAISQFLLPLGTFVSATILQLFLALPASLLLLSCFSFLRSSPVKLSDADSSLVAASPTPTVALVHLDLFAQMLLNGLVGVIIGLSLGMVFEGILRTFIAPWELAVICALLLILICTVSWLLGLIRLHLRRAQRRVLAVVVMVILFAASLLFSLFIMNLSAPLVVYHQLSLDFPVVVVCLCGLTAIFFIVLSLVASRLSATVLIVENALYAELYPLRHLQFYDADSYKNLRRRKVLAQRGARLCLPGSNNPHSLISRAILSHMRQYEGILYLALTGVFITPFGAFLLISELSPLFFLMWAAMLALRPVSQRELTLVFRDDQRNRMLRSHLPFSTTTLLLLDSLPALAFTCFCSLVAITVLLFPVALNVLAGVVLVLAINLAFVVCSGLESVKLTSSDWHFSYEFSLFVFVGALYVLSLIAPALSALGALAILAFYFVLLRQGRE